jgi:ribosomal protein L36
MEPVERFIQSSKLKHGNTYNYSKVKYVHRRSAVTIICKKHGEFKQEPRLHLRGSGCPVCAGFYRNTDEFIQKAKEIHGDTYEYHQSSYTGSKSKIDIVCKQHGVFKQRASAHLCGNGCPKCGSEKQR